MIANSLLRLPCSEAVFCSAVAFVYNYTSPTTGIAYYLNTTLDSQSGAERVCRSRGGHLVMYSSPAEQSEVESAFIYQGGLINGYHKAYWIGLKARNWADFRCVRPDGPSASASIPVVWLACMMLQAAAP